MALPVLGSARRVSYVRPVTDRNLDQDRKRIDVLPQHHGSAETPVHFAGLEFAQIRQELLLALRDAAKNGQHSFGGADAGQRRIFAPCRLREQDSIGFPDRRR